VKRNIDIFYARLIGSQGVTRRSNSIFNVYKYLVFLFDMYKKTLYTLIYIKKLTEIIYRVADLSEDIEISQKLSPANKNVSDKSCMVSRGT